MPGSIFQSLVSIIILLGILYLAYIASKYLGTASVKRSSSKHIKLLDITSIGQDKAIAAIKVGQKQYLIGIAPNGINKIADLEEQDILEMLEDVEEDNPLKLEGFKDIFNKQKGK